MNHWISVAVQTPAHSSVAGPLTYRSELPLPPGTLVRAPLGSREVLGIVWSPADGPLDGRAAEATRAIAGALEGIEPLSAPWLELVAFAAGYYQRALGELALAETRPVSAVRQPPAAARPRCTCTAVQAAAGARPHAQALVMVPEINLTPQLEARFNARFGAATAVVSLHSGMTNPQRLKSWLAAHSGAGAHRAGHAHGGVCLHARAEALIIVDEEHDPSYKQQEGARYSARDLAVYRGSARRRQGAAGLGHAFAGELAPQPPGQPPTTPGGRYSAW
jgi:primosomal protein N' (replication factor Y)